MSMTEQLSGLHDVRGNFSYFKHKVLEQREGSVSHSYK